MSNPQFIDVQKALKGISYPADRDQLVEHAQRNKADSTIIETLRSLKNQTFSGPDAVTSAVTDAAGERGH